MDVNSLNNFYNGFGLDSYNIFGAHILKDSVVFRLYAPNAKSVRVIGDFNKWDYEANYMFKSSYGYWETEIAGLKEYTMYKYVVEQIDGTKVEKADPFGFFNELRPGWCNKVVNLDFNWQDENWMKSRSRCFDKPMNIYEMHLGGFKKNEDDKWFTYYEMIEKIIPYVKEMGYTHIELMPLNEHALDMSWGYQQYGYYSITSRYGSPYQLMMFINECHKNGIGVIMDIVLVHFLKDNFGLGKFDGTPLFESSDPKNAESEWGTYYFDFGKQIVRSFLLSSACLWLDKYHIDGLRLDAVSNLIYFQGNKSKGVNENAISFIKRFNYHIHEKFPTVFTVAEDSSDYPKVTGNVTEGLGFDYKWDLGWMNDTFKYYKMDPEFRHYHHNLINFSMAYYYNEHYLLPLSHDEVVHSKGTVIDKMYGTYEDKFKQCRNLMVYMMTHPGKKLNFMGNEIASFREFDENKSLDWLILNYPTHDSFKRLCRDLNHIYKDREAFYKYDYQRNGFKWIDADNNDGRVYSYMRFDDKKCYVVVLNMAPVSYELFQLGVPYLGVYTELFNSEKDIYSGCNMCNFKPLTSYKGEKNGFKNHLDIRLAPYAGIIFETDIKEEKTILKEEKAEKVCSQIKKNLKKNTVKESSEDTVQN